MISACCSLCTDQCNVAWPQFVHVQVVPDVVSENSRMVPDLTALVSYPVGSFDIHFGYTFRELQHPLRIYFSTDDFEHNNQPNLAITGLTLCSNPFARFWSGPVLILKAVDSNSTTFADVVQDDVADICTFFSLHM